MTVQAPGRMCGNTDMYVLWWCSDASSIFPGVLSPGVVNPVAGKDALPAKISAQDGARPVCGWPATFEAAQVSREARGGQGSAVIHWGAAGLPDGESRNCPSKLSKHSQAPSLSLVGAKSADPLTAAAFDFVATTWLRQGQVRTVLKTASALPSLAHLSATSVPKCES